MVRRWECKQCGYIHEGAEPPEVCPVCGAGRSQFMLLTDAPTESVKPVAVKHGLMSATLHLHPILVHFPNGLIPTVWLFLGLYLLTGRPVFEEGALWLVVVVFVSTPLALASGLYSWRKLYAGEAAPIFTQKIALAVVLLLLGGVALLLRLNVPGMLAQVIYFCCLAGMLVCVTLLGYLGGKLVFSARSPTG